MKMLLATAALALAIGAVAEAQDVAPEGQADQQPADAPEAAPAETAVDDEADIGGATGLTTGAIGETFFIRAPQEFHLLVSEMPGHPVFFDTTPTGIVSPVTEEPEAAGTVEEAIRQGEAPVGVVADVVLDRRGGAAGLVIELDEEMRGGAREVAVAMGLIRMLPDPEDPASTHILLSLDPVDMENAPTFERPGAGDEGGAAVAPQDGQATQGDAAAENAEPQQ